MNPSLAILLKKLEENLGYFFQDPELLVQAVTHRSYVHENPSAGSKDNERLEFLGDSVLNLSLSHLIFHRYPELDEGELSRMRAGLVNESQFRKLAEKLGLGKCLRLGRGEEKSGGREKGSLLADAFEALLGAIYLEAGYEAAFRVTETLLTPVLRSSRAGLLRGFDFKTELQEYCQGRYKKTPDYEVLKEEGPDHRKLFYVKVRLAGLDIGQGQGRSKKAAEQEAARAALGQLQGE
ncbi:MAG: ribonuclease III [Deltaproteobacteria bacterium]|nr:ribonuclease III [Deltaproteobacteria bacterium]